MYEISRVYSAACWKWLMLHHDVLSLPRHMTRLGGALILPSWTSKAATAVHTSVKGCRPCGPWSWFSPPCPFVSLPGRGCEKGANLFNTYDIDAAMAAGYAFVWAANGNWNVICLVCTRTHPYTRCVRMCLPATRPRSPPVPGGIVGES